MTASAELHAFVRAGGPVLGLLLGLGVWLAAALVLRARVLRRGHRGPVEGIWTTGKGRPGVLTLARALLEPSPGVPPSLTRMRLDQLRGRLRTFRRTVRTLSEVAPMLGLLGTVAGMIRTFSALGTGRASVDVAAGIAEALVTTELGLALALPGLGFGLWLERRELRLRRELDVLEQHAPRGRS